MSNIDQKHDSLEYYTSIASFEGRKAKIVIRYALQTGARELLPKERVATCMRFHAPGKNIVSVKRSETSKKAHFSGLMVCGSVWHCPVCAARVSEQRRKELEQAYLRWTGGVFMVTYTLSHNMRTDLAVLLKQLNESTRAFKSGDWFLNIKDHYGWLGSVKSLEVTYGSNGFHPHAHELVFTTNELSNAIVGNLEIVARERWSRIVRRLGGTVKDEIGLKITQSGDSLRDYITKWGHDPVDSDKYEGWNVASEITKQVSKMGKQGGRTPTQLLYDYVANDDFQAGEAWKIYAHALKGKNQLVWSRGMRELLGIGKEQTDEQIAETEPPESEVIATITKEEWRVVLRYKMRGEILWRGGYMNPDEFRNWLAEELAARQAGEPVV